MWRKQKFKLYYSNIESLSQQTNKQRFGEGDWRVSNSKIGWKKKPNKFKQETRSKHEL